MGTGSGRSWVKFVEALKAGKCTAVWDDVPCTGRLKFVKFTDHNQYRIGCDICGSHPQEMHGWMPLSRENATRAMLYAEVHHVTSRESFGPKVAVFHKERFERKYQEHNEASQKEQQSRRGIPTTYKGIEYRSRLEAKWAYFFDMLGWPYQYEPYELDGYIPDFALTFGNPILVEVKPVCSIDEVVQKCQKPIHAAWNENRRVLIVGGHIGYHGDPDISLGKQTYFNVGWLAYGPDEFDECDESNITSAPFMVCPHCKRISTYPVGADKTCIRCGKSVEGIDLKTQFYSDMMQVKLMNMWQKATNVVQYNKPISAGA